MWESLISLIGTFWNHLLPFTVIDQYEMAVCLRLGKHQRTLKPGFHFKIPFVDSIMTQSVVTDTYNLQPQALTTLDNKEIVVSAVVRYTISDVKTFLLEVSDEDSVIPDICLGAIRSILTSKTWEECQDKKIDTPITAQVRQEIAKYGVTVEKVRLIDMTKSRSYRIFSDGGLLTLLFAVWLTFGMGKDYYYQEQYWSYALNFEWNGFTMSGGQYYTPEYNTPVFDMTYELEIFK